MSIYSEEAVQQILALLDPVEVLKRLNYRPETIQAAKNQIKCFCPIHKEAVFRTMLIEAEEKRFRCSYTLCPGARGGNLIQLYALAKGVSEGQALPELVEAFGLNVDLPTATAFLERTLSIAQNFLEMEVAEEAEAAFRKALEIDPQSLRGHRGLVAALALGKKTEQARAERLELARLAREQGQLEMARQSLEEHLAERPEDDPRRLELIEVFRALGLEEEQARQYMAMAERHGAEGRVDEALKMYRAVEQLNFGVVDVFPHIVDLLKASGRRGEAVAEHLKRAEALEAQGLRDAALEFLAEALEIDPERGDIRRRAIEAAAAGALTGNLLERAVGWVDGFIERRAYGQAFEAIEQLQTRAPGEPRLHERALRILQLQGKTREADILHLRLVDERLAQGDLDGALQGLDAVLQTRPDSPDLLRRKAEALARAGRLEAAKRAYADLLVILRRDHDLSKAVETYGEALALQPDDLALLEERLSVLNEMGEAQGAVAACVDLAARYLDRDQGDLALERLDMALALAPSDPSVHQQRARTAERLGRGEEAMRSRLKAADCHMAGGRFAEAAAVLEEAVKIDPEEPEALERLVSCQEQLGEAARAVKNLQELVSLFHRKEQWERCEAGLRRVLALDPGSIEARDKLADVLGRMGRGEEEIVLLHEAAEKCLAESTYSRAEQLCQRILERRPNHVGALEMLIRVQEAAQKTQAVQSLWLRLADVHHAREDRPSERQVYETILERWPENLEARRRYVFLLWDQQDLMRIKEEARKLVDGLLRLRRFEEAAALLRQLQRLAPDEPLFVELAADLFEKWARPEEWSAAVRALADLYRRRGLYTEAANWTGRLVERNPRDESLRADLIGLLLRDERAEEAAAQYASLGRLHMERAAWDDAIAAYKAALDLNPGYDEGMMALVRLNFQKQDCLEALRYIHALAALHEHREKYDEAISVLRLAFEIDRESIDVRKKIIEILRARGAVDEAATEIDSLRALYEAHEQWDAAAALLRQKIELQPQEAGPREQLIDLLRRRGRHEERFEEELALAEFHLRREAFDSATAILDRLVEDEPSSMRARRLRAEAYARAGQDKKALADFLHISSRLEEWAPAAHAQAPPALTEPKLNLVPEYVFDSFVVGAHNNFAYATTSAVAKAPGQTYNPLFLYADVGMGKTHLLHAIANYAQTHHPSLNVLYTSAEEFTTELIEAIESNTVKQFRARHKSTDMLLLDDVQFLAGKERAQEEFFHIFNTLYQAQRQIVVTSDRPPKAMAHLEKRLVSRFGAGVIVDIQAPDLETRIAILQRQIKQVQGISLPESLAAHLAERQETNVRELKGAFNQVVALARLSGQQPTEESLDQIIAKISQSA